MSFWVIFIHILIVTLIGPSTHFGDFPMTATQFSIEDSIGGDRRTMYHINHQSQSITKPQMSLIQEIASLEVQKKGPRSLHKYPSNCKESNTSRHKASNIST